MAVHFNESIAAPRGNFHAPLYEAESTFSDMQHYWLFTNLLKRSRFVIQVGVMLIFYDNSANMQIAAQ